MTVNCSTLHYLLTTAWWIYICIVGNIWKLNKSTWTNSILNKITRRECVWSLLSSLKLPEPDRSEMQVSQGPRHLLTENLSFHQCNFQRPGRKVDFVLEIAQRNKTLTSWARVNQLRSPFIFTYASPSRGKFLRKNKYSAKKCPLSIVSRLLMNWSIGHVFHSIKWMIARKQCRESVGIRTEPHFVTNGTGVERLVCSQCARIST